MSDLNFQEFSTVQSKAQRGPNTLASAATMVPTSFLTKVTGTVQIANITPPVTGIHVLAFVFTNAAPGVLLTTGNILNAVTPTQDVPTMFLYDPVQRKYYAWANNLT